VTDRFGVTTVFCLMRPIGPPAEHLLFHFIPEVPHLHVSCDLAAEKLASVLPCI
jgi:hypothetical protein